MCQVLCTSSYIFYKAKELSEPICSCIPGNLQELKTEDKKEKQGMENVKKKLDEYLRAIPDAPGTTQNSILQQI